MLGVTIFSDINGVIGKMTKQGAPRKLTEELRVRLSITVSRETKDKLDSVDNSRGRTVDKLVKEAKL